MPYFKSLCEAARNNNPVEFINTLSEAKLTLGEEHYLKIINQFNAEGRALIHLTTHPAIIYVLTLKGAHLNALTLPEKESILDLYNNKKVNYTESSMCIFLERIIRDGLFDKEVINLAKLDILIESATKNGHLKVLALAKKARDQARDLIMLKETILKNDFEKFTIKLAQIKERNPNFNINKPDCSGATWLGYSIQAENIRIFEFLIAENADVNQFTSGYRPLNLAINFMLRGENSYSSFKATGPLVNILTSLVNHPKIDLAATYAQDRSLMSKLAVSFRRSDFPHINSELAELWDKLRIASIAAHRYSLKGYITIEGYGTDLEGFQIGVPPAEIIESFQDFLNDPSIRIEANGLLNMLYCTSTLNYFDPRNPIANIFSKVQEDLSCVGRKIEAKEFLERDHNEEITSTIVSTTIDPKSEGDHAMAYLTFNDICIRVNRGDTVSPNRAHGITVYKIGAKAEFNSAFPKLLHSAHKPVNDSYLLGEFLQLSKMEPMHSIEMSAQVVGNCSWSSLEGLVNALFFAHIYKHFKRPLSSVRNSDDECLRWAEIEARKFTNLFMRFDRERGLKQLKSTERYFPNDLKAEAEREANTIIRRDTIQDKYWLPSYQSRNPLKQESGQGLVNKMVTLTHHSSNDLRS